MIAIDTSVLVRVVTNDDLEQTKRAVKATVRLRRLLLVGAASPSSWAPRRVRELEIDPLTDH